MIRAARNKHRDQATENRHPRAAQAVEEHRRLVLVRLLLDRIQPGRGGRGMKGGEGEFQGAGRGSTFCFTLPGGREGRSSPGDDPQAAPKP